MTVGVVTHLICAGAFGALAVALLMSERRGRIANMLALAAIATLGWALAGASGGAVPVSILAIIEGVRNAAWLLFLCTLLAASGGSAGWARKEIVVTVAVALAALGIDLVTLVLAPSARALTHVEIMARIAVAVLGLSLVENYYRNTEPDERWNVILLSIAVGAIFAFDLFYYVDGFLSAMDRAYASARALADALTTPLIALAMARSAKRWADIRMSRKAAFHAVTLVSSGIFLVSAAFVGLLFRRYGGQWGLVLQVTLIFGSAVVLVTVLSSETARSGIRMAVLRNFFSYRYDYRVEWLRSIEAFAAGDVAGALSERVIRALADTVNSPGGVLFLGRDHVYVPHDSWNAHLPPDAQEPVDSAFIAAFRGGRWIAALRADGPEGAASPRPAWLVGHEEFWLAVPLPHANEIIGFIMLVTPRAPVNPDWEVYDLLRILARQAAGYLSEQQAQRALADAQMLQEYSKRFAFVVHDIKNLSSQLGLILSNARRHAGNPEFQADVMRTVENSVARMTHLLSQLKMATAPEPPAALAATDAAAIVRELVAGHPHAARIDTEYARAAAPVTMAAEPLRSVLSHLIDNALEASGTQGRVTVALRSDAERVTIDVADEGPGMDANFVRDELFRPFRSTKDGGFGIGAFQTRELVRAGGGNLEVSSRPGAGTTMRVVLKHGENTPSTIHPAA